MSLRNNKTSNLTLEERERIAYINGDTETAALLAKLDDNDHHFGSIITEHLVDTYDNE
jgi:hypothetical protein